MIFSKILNKQSQLHYGYQEKWILRAIQNFEIHIIATIQIFLCLFIEINDETTRNGQ